MLFMGIGGVGYVGVPVAVQMGLVDAGGIRGTIGWVG